jgi:hypothetical protein
MKGEKPHTIDDNPPILAVYPIPVKSIFFGVVPSPYTYEFSLILLDLDGIKSY